MEVAILYCQDCFFSERAHAQILKSLQSIVGTDRQILNLGVHTYDLKDIDNHLKATQIYQAKAQIVILSQHFLDRLKHQTNLQKKASINRILRPKRVVAILLNVTSEEVTEGFQAYLTQFSQWHGIELKSSNKIDPEFYKNFTHQIIKIYNLELSNSINFSIFPKKVTKDQPKVVILFKMALDVMEKSRLELSRGRQKEVIPEVMMSNPHTGMIRIPSSMCGERTGLIEITVYVNDKKLGTKLVKYDHNSKTSEEDVIDKMSSAIPGFLKALDDHLSQQLSKNFRSCEDYTLDPSLELMNDALISRSDDFPTPMHFAVNYGLEQTVCVLLYEGDGLDQCDIKNDFGETAVDVATERGFTTILQAIKDFQEMNSTFGALHYIKNLCDSQCDGQVVNSDDMFSSSSPLIAVASELDHVDEDNGIITEAQQENPEYLLVKCERTEEYTMIEEASEGVSALEIVEQESSIQEPMIQIDAPPIPSKDFKYTNLSSDNMARIMEHCIIEPKSRNSLLKNYDVPPRRNPPVILKPPRKFAPGAKLSPKIGHYDVPRRSIDGYCHIPATSPVNSPGDSENLTIEEMKQPTTPVFSIKSTLHQDLEGYILVNGPTNLNPRLETSHQSSLTSGNVSSVPLKKDWTGDSGIKYPKVEPPVIEFPSGISKSGFLNPQNASALPLTKQFSIDSTQEELLELMNDFKNNVYNLRELELLYENWKMRNDVQRDFKARQKELRQIQKEYRKIQEKVRSESKKSGPISKLLKFMPGSKKKSLVINVDEKEEASEQGLENEDPLRKVSGSSDPGSVVSETSFPDSNVSDSEDKDKNQPSYVSPSDFSVPESEVVVSLQNLDTENPPSRPLKTVSSDASPICVEGNSLPSAKVCRVKQPVQKSKESERHAGGDSESTIMENVRDDAPLPPPRIHNHIFSYVDYKSKSKGLPRQSQNEFCFAGNSKMKQVKNYENQELGKKK